MSLILEGEKQIDFELVLVLVILHDCVVLDEEVHELALDFWGFLLKDQIQLIHFINNPNNTSFYINFTHFNSE